MRYFVAGNFWLFIALLMFLFKVKMGLAVRFTNFGGNFTPIFYYVIIISIAVIGGAMISKGKES